MIDAPTKSLWSHLLGECMAGDLRGVTLESIPSDMVTWQAWREAHPTTTVINLSRTSKNYTKEFYKRPEEFVLGFDVDGKAYHCTFTELMRMPLVNLDVATESLVIAFDVTSTGTRIFSRKLDGTALTFASLPNGQMKDDASGSVWNCATGKCISGQHQGKELSAYVGIVSFTKAWMTFHPDSRVQPSAK